MIFSRAKSFRGLWGNIRFLIFYKTWATLVVFALGVLLGLIPGLVFAESLEERLKRHEGVRHCVYYDVFHNPTIGVGHLLKKPVERNTCWTSEQVERVLEHDIYRARHNAAADYGPGFYSLPEPVSDLLTELSFQLGGSGLSTFTTFMGLLRDGKYRAASADLLETRLAKQLPMRTKEQAKILERVK